MNEKMPRYFKNAKAKANWYAQNPQAFTRTEKAPGPLPRARNGLDTAYDPEFVDSFNYYAAKHDRERFGLPTDDLEEARRGQMANLLGLNGEENAEDTVIAHLTPGEIVIPLNHQTPELMQYLSHQMGDDLLTYTVGSGQEQINPESGLPAFAEQNETETSRVNSTGHSTPNQHQIRSDELDVFTDNDWTENIFLKGNHRYNHVSEALCDMNDPNCSIDHTTKLLNRYGVLPGQTHEFVPGQYYEADANIIGPWGPDHITSTALYNKSGQQIGVRNETLQDHILHPGIVERRLVKHNGKLHILTEGGGGGYFGGPNVYIDDWLWDGVDDEVKKRL